MPIINPDFFYNKYQMNAQYLIYYHVLEIYLNHRILIIIDIGVMNNPKMGKICNTELKRTSTFI